MSKKHSKKKNGFKIFMGIYVAVFLIATGVGLYIFWDFIECFELSRPQHAMEAYVDQLTEEHILDLSPELLTEEMLKMQGQGTCAAYIAAELENVSFRKNPSASNDDQMIYTLRSGPKVVGQITMTPQQTDKFGFVYWAVSGEEFDLSYLVSRKPVAVTVPDNFQVRINGNLLDASYQTETGIRYDLMEEFYDDYALPGMVTYQAGPFMGEVEMTVTDAAGNPVVIDENTDYNQFILNNCSEEKAAELGTFMNDYIKHLVAFTASTKNNVRANYYKLQKYMVKGGDLDKRMYSAFGTYEYAQNKKDEIASLTMNHIIDIGNDRYLCDMTYLVNTTGREGVVQTTNNVKVIAVNTEDGLRAEAMTSY